MERDLQGLSVERIMGRLAREWRVDISRAAPARWIVAFQLDDGRVAEASIELSPNADGALELRCDAPAMTKNEDDGKLLAAFVSDLSSRLTREKVVFADGEALYAHLEETCHGHRGEGFVSLEHVDAEDVPLLVSMLRVAGEPWVNVVIVAGTRDEIDPVAAVRVNAELAYASLALVDALDRYDLGYSLPLVSVTASRLDEIIDDLAMLRAGLRKRLVEGEGDAEDAEDAPSAEG